MGHNSFAVPIITTTAGILNWITDEIDIETRKQFKMSRNLHPKGDIIKSYLRRGEGGSGIKILGFLHKQGQQEIIRLN